jgi:hypothetical protein
MMRISFISGLSEK